MGEYLKTIPYLLKTQGKRISLFTMKYVKFCMKILKLHVTLKKYIDHVERKVLKYE
jgi:hypothetical protein